MKFMEVNMQAIANNGDPSIDFFLEDSLNIHLTYFPEIFYRNTSAISVKLSHHRT